MFTYDKRSRVVEVTDAGVVADYEYGSGPGAVDAPSGVTTGGVTESFSYDANGNRLTGAGQTLGWDVFNRLVSVTEGGATTGFLYGPDGERVARVTGPDDYTVYPGGFEWRVTGGVGELRYEYTVGGRLVAVRTGVSGDAVYVFGDHLGSASVTYDPATGQVGRQLFEPFGDVRYSTGTMGTDRGYTGQITDTSTGLLFYNARYYDPATKQFISPDTWTPDPTRHFDWNRYAYVHNNPVNYTDPTGHVLLFPTIADRGDCDSCRPYGLPNVAFLAGAGSGFDLDRSEGTADDLESIMGHPRIEPVVWGASNHVTHAWGRLNICDKGYDDCHLQMEAAGLASALRAEAGSTPWRDVMMCHSEGCAAVSYALATDPALADEYWLLIAMAPAAYKNGAIEQFIDRGGSVVLVYDDQDLAMINARKYGLLWGELDSGLGVEGQIKVRMDDAGHSGMKDPSNPTSSALTGIGWVLGWWGPNRPLVGA